MTAQNIIPSYLYVQYNDDDNLAGFVSAYNQTAQPYLDWFNQNPLAVYTNALFSGTILDWLITGIYGLPRPAISVGRLRTIGPYNTFLLNQLVINGRVRIVEPDPDGQTFYTVNDDVYRRVTTWSFFKGDGKIFNVRWLKTRITRFLLGVNGTAPNIDTTYLVSVAFAPGNVVNITITGTNPDRDILAAAISSGALPLPFQYSYTVSTP
jgi:hypothetical protein